MYIEYTSGDKYEKIVLSQQEYDSNTIPYQRGDITDTKGTVLATSQAVYNVILDCKVINAKPETIEPTLSAIGQCFPEIDVNEVRGILTESPNKAYTVLAKQLPYDEIQQMVEIQTDSDNYPNVSDGIWFEKEYVREYPYDFLASSIIGFTTSGNLGVTGLENYYDDTLNGINGREYGYLNSDNNFEKTIREATDGYNIVTTIDANIQSVVEEKINNFQLENANVDREGMGSTHTAVLIMDPNNGEVLAMGQYPSYDLSNPRDLSGLYTEEELSVMTDDEKMDILNNLWQNFCVSYTYEPGSTSKPFTVAAGLETGTMTGNETYYCDGSETISGSTIHCVNRSGHGMQTVRETIMNSCNDALMQMSYAIGVDNFTKYQQIFNFGLKTNIDLPGEARTDSLIYTTENMTAIDLATNSFGQNYNCTMVQLGSAFCSLINGGYYYQPHVVKRITDSDGNTIEEIDKKLVKQTVSAGTSETLKGYLYSTVSEGGTGKYAKVDGYSMGGKTGTAQKAGRDGKNYLVSFIGYAPADDPQVMIYCIVDEPNAVEQYHSSFAQQIVKEILTEILPYMNIYPDQEITPDTSDETGTTSTGTDTADTTAGAQNTDAATTTDTTTDAPTGQTGVADGAATTVLPADDGGGEIDAPDTM